MILITWFICYALVFTQTKFYAVTENYVSAFVFVMCGLLFLNNVPWIKLLKEKDREIYVLLVLSVLVMVNMYIVKSGLGAFAAFGNFILIWYMSKYIRLSARQLSVLSALYLALWLFWAILDDSYNLAYKFNTNTGATFFIFTLFGAFYLLKKLADKRELYGLLIVIAFVRGVNLALWHRARGAFIMIGAFLFFYYLLPKGFWKSKNWYAALWGLATIGSLVFVVGYTMLGQTGFNIPIPFFYKNLFSGRQLIWGEVLSRFVKQPLTGFGTGFELDIYKELNVHNSMLNLLTVYGVIVFIGILWFVFRRLREFRELAVKNTLSLYGLCAVLAVFFESFFDNDLVWANYALNLLFLLAVINAGREDADGKV